MDCADPPPRYRIGDPEHAADTANVAVGVADDDRQRFGSDAKGDRGQ